MSLNKSFEEYLIECNEESIKKHNYDNLKNFRFHTYLAKECKDDGRSLR